MNMIKFSTQSKNFILLYKSEGILKYSGFHGAVDMHCPAWLYILLYVF